MFKKALIVLIAVVLMGLILNIGLMHAQKSGEEKTVSSEKGSQETLEEILNKLDQILENQAEIISELYQIKGRS